MPNLYSSLFDKSENLSALLSNQLKLPMELEQLNVMPLLRTFLIMAVEGPGSSSISGTWLLCWLGTSCFPSARAEFQQNYPRDNNV